MSTLRTMIGPDDHTAGPRDAPISVVEYGDYECPYCSRADTEVKRLLAALGDSLCFAFRNFPLSQLHPHALQAAEAAEAAGAQGKFWEMHDLLFEHQDALETPLLISYARLLDLDLHAFDHDVEGHRFLERIHGEFIGGVRSGVNGTPTFFINGERHDGAPTYPALLAAIEGGPQAHAF